MTQGGGGGEGRDEAIRLREGEEGRGGTRLYDSGRVRRGGKERGYMTQGG